MFRARCASVLLSVLKFELVVLHGLSAESPRFHLFDTHRVAVDDQIVADSRAVFFVVAALWNNSIISGFEGFVIPDTDLELGKRLVVVTLNCDFVVDFSTRNS